MTMGETMDAFWRRYLTTLPGTHPHRRARPTVFAFGDSAALGAELLALVLQGRKRATAGLPIEFTAAGDPLPEAGDVSIVTQADGTPAAIIEILEVKLVPFRDVDSAFAAEEGEDDGTLTSWRAAHRAYFGRVGARLGGPFDETELIVCQRFRLLWAG